MKHCLSAALAALTLAGCANVDTHASFFTKTSMALADIDSTPSGVSIGYQRAEGYLGPRLSDGNAVPVVAFIRTDGELLGRSLEQIYATGCAAETVTAPNESAPPGPACRQTAVKELTVRPMLFVTGTSFGAAFGLSEGNAPSLTLGYKRKEASIIPVEPGSMPSVLARHGNEVQAGVKANLPTGQLGLSQFFATGRAAESLAALPSVRGVFRDNAESAVGAYREQERLQSLHTLTTLGCLSAVRDGQLPAVWRNAEAIGLLPPGTSAAGLETAGAAKARETYTKHLAILNADSADTTGLLALHRRFVCDLSKKA